MIRLDEVFDILLGQSLELISCEEINNGILFISRTSSNNGVATRIKKLENLDPMPKHAITVALGGSVLSSFYQSEPFYTAFHIACLYPRVDLTEAEMLFYCYVIEQNKYRYNYGRQANRTLKEILVPSYDELPDYINKINTKPVFKKNPLSSTKLSLNIGNWRWFDYVEIFDIRGSKTTPKLYLEECGEGEYPYVTTKAINNGIDGFYNICTENGNVFTVDSAVLGFCAYQIKDFSASDHVEKLIPLFECNIYIAMFITTLINIEQYRYNYGRKCSQTKLSNSKIKLPATKEGQPNWEFMENYIKSLPYSACL